MNKKGFTLIELLTVIAILGILVLIAAPKFLGYTEKANIAKIQTGIKAVETAIDLKSLENLDLTKGWDVLEPDNLQEINDSGKLIDKKGHIKENLEGGKKIPLKNLDVKWRSGGEFILDADGESVYYYNKNINVSKKPDGSANIPGDGEGSGDGDGGTPPIETTPPVEEPKEPEITYPITDADGNKIDEDGTITKPDGTVIKPDGSTLHPNGDIEKPNGDIVKPNGDIYVKQPDGSLIPVATDDDFTWVNTATSFAYTVPGKENGYYKYTGTHTAVIIPERIEGNKITSYFYMFDSSKVTKVISLNKDVTSMRGMFRFSSATSLDLSSLDTSNVTDMTSMFEFSKVTSLDLSNWNTSNVTKMYSMFSSSKATSLDLSSFNTSKVTDMGLMFHQSEATTLNLSSFNTSRVTNMRWMFNQSKAKVLDLSSFNMSSIKFSTNVDIMFRNSSATVGYARTSADANWFNTSATDRPSGLTFIVK